MKLTLISTKPNRKKLTFRKPRVYHNVLFPEEDFVTSKLIYWWGKHPYTSGYLRGRFESGDNIGDFLKKVNSERIAIANNK